MSLTRRGLLGLAVGSLGAAIAGCTIPGGTRTPSASSTAPKVTIGLTYVPNIQFAPFYVAEASGTYAKSGVNVTLRHHGSAEGLFTALVAGQEDFVVAGADEMLQARAQGMDLVAIAQYYRTYPVVAIVKDASPIQAASDLRGKRIGVPAKFGSSWFALKVLLSNAGLTESDVTIIDTHFTQDAALQDDKADAIMGFSNNDAVLLPINGVPVRTLPLGSGTVPLIGVSLITTQKLLDTIPEIARKVTAATTAAFTATAQDQAAAVTTSADYVTTLKTDAAARSAAAQILEATVALWKGPSGAISTAFDEAQFDAMAQFMKSQGFVATAVDAKQAMSNAYQF